MIGNVTNTEFARQWYQPEDIHRWIARMSPSELRDAIPKNITSREFANWLSEQYQLAILKGMEIMEREIEGRTKEANGHE